MIDFLKYMAGLIKNHVASPINLLPLHSETSLNELVNGC